MKPLNLNIALGILLAAAGLQCGENVSPAVSGSSFGPPLNLKAVSVDRSTVRLQWSAAAGASDSAFGGYVVRYGSVRDSVSKTVLTYTADSLNPGEVLFSLFSRRVDGQLSSGTTIRWAPAERFDSAYVLLEAYQFDPGRTAGFDVGSQSTNPSTMEVTAVSPASLDLFLYGGSGNVSEPLEFRSGSMYEGSRNVTLFSTVRHSAGSLDYPLSAFPASASFTETNVLITDNMIYYVRVVGDAGSVNYARVHVHALNASFPNRSVELRVSLQRVPGSLFAHVAPRQGKNLLATIVPVQ